MMKIPLARGGQRS